MSPNPVSKVPFSDAGERFSPHLVPFSLPTKWMGDRDFRILEDGGAATRALIRGVLGCYVLAPIIVAFGWLIMFGPESTVMFCRVPLGALLVWFAVLSFLLWLAKGARRPSREIRYVTGEDHLELKSADVNRYLQSTRRYKLSEWTIRIHPVELHPPGRPGAGWRGYAAIAYMNRHKIPLATSRKVERIAAYLATLPPALQTIAEDTTVIVGEAVFGGDLRG